jgi:hypothetical protein
VEVANALLISESVDDGAIGMLLVVRERGCRIAREHRERVR